MPDCVGCLDCAIGGYVDGIASGHVSRYSSRIAQGDHPCTLAPGDSGGQQCPCCGVDGCVSDGLAGDRNVVEAEPVIGLVVSV